MIPLLLAVGATGAVLELKRFVLRGGGEASLPEGEQDSERNQENEARLRDLLQASCAAHRPPEPQSSARDPGCAV